MAGEGETMSDCLMGTEFQLQDEKALEKDDGDSCTTR